MFMALGCVEMCLGCAAVLRDWTVLLFVRWPVLSLPLLGNKSYIIAVAYFSNYTGNCVWLC